MGRNVKVWDIPTRIFHWLMVVLLALLWWSAEQGEMEWHMISAYVLAGLLLFRIIWGVWGSQTARFTDFVVSPANVWRYTKTLPRQGIIPHHGHNPLGGYMVIVLLLVMTTQFTTGLFATDDIFTEGPLYAWVSSDTSAILTWLHKNNFNLILFLASVHVLAVLVHVGKGDKLLPAMVTGYRRDGCARQLFFKSLWQAALLFGLIAVGLGYYLIWPLILQLV
ncbi:cytochrome b561 [Shewanella sp. NFH-SH190041]|uniref:cytochrome b/b6 domain-containing protein n=1 Tax=Shewanella sp. NFH-SH190041 TaxID=2950245 RepID=UPI0021C2C452|nr:cytochrome b/b6 domain-containing protein [Shewanella sp. NFH-SH190041]BDM63646.1 cytochrome b561 [Shewanella sp. NFH-SH190041]